MRAEDEGTGAIDFADLGECEFGDCHAGATNVTEEDYRYCATHVVYFYSAVAALTGPPQYHAQRASPNEPTVPNEEPR